MTNGRTLLGRFCREHCGHLCRAVLLPCMILLWPHPLCQGRRIGGRRCGCMARRQLHALILQALRAGPVAVQRQALLHAHASMPAARIVFRLCGLHRGSAVPCQTLLLLSHGWPSHPQSSLEAPEACASDVHVGANSGWPGYHLGLAELSLTVCVQDRIAEVQTALNRAKLPFGARKVHPMSLDTYEFKLDKKDYNVYWDVRKGLIPIVGGARETGNHHACPSRASAHHVGRPLLWGRQACRIAQGLQSPLPSMRACLRLLLKLRAACCATSRLLCALEILRDCQLSFSTEALRHCQLCPSTEALRLCQLCPSTEALRHCRLCPSTEALRQFYCLQGRPCLSRMWPARSTSWRT